MARKRNYSKEYQRRNALARAQGFTGYAARRTALERKTPFSKQELTPRQQVRQQKAFQVVRTMTEKGLSLTQAAKKHGTTPGTVIRYIGQDQFRREGRRWIPTQAFRRSRKLAGKGEKVFILTENGMTEVSISDPRTLSKYGRYLNAVKGSLRNYPESMQELATFEGKTFIDAKGNKYPYITDRKLLSHLYDDGKIEMEDFYAEMAR